LRPVIAFQKHEGDAAAKMRSTPIVGQIDSPATMCDLLSGRRGATPSGQTSRRVKKLISLVSSTPCPLSSLPSKIFSFFFPEIVFSSSPSRLTRGAFRDRHER
jgi:hypothetical protein